MALASLLNLQRGVISAIGSGGKTTLLSLLCRELSAEGTVILCTTTHIFPPRLPVADPTEQTLPEILRQTPVFCAARAAGEGKLGAASLAPELLAKYADFVLTEADGSRGLPLKAHRPGEEPVIPAACRQTILVVGASAFGKPVAQVCHRPELFCRLTGAAPSQPVTPELTALALNREGLPGTVFLNQITPEELPAANAFRGALGRAILTGDLQKEWYTWLY